VEIFGCAGDGGQVITIKQSSNQTRKFLTQRNKGERLSARRSKDFGASRKKVDQTPREAQQLAYSVDSIVLPSFSVLKNLLA
jgi:hypothetical protein